LQVWGEAWAFDDPRPEELNSVLLMWQMRNGVHRDQLPDDRIVVQFDFYGAATVTFWLILTRTDVTLCLTDPEYELNVLVTSDLVTMFKLWRGRISYHEALDNDNLKVDGSWNMVHVFPSWFGWDKIASSANYH